MAEPRLKTPLHRNTMPQNYKNMKKILIANLLSLVIAIAIPALVQANYSRLLAVVELDDGLKPQYVAEAPNAGPIYAGKFILQMIAGSLIMAAGPLAVLMLAIGGFQYVISHGEQNTMENAKKTITYALMGLGVIIVSYAIIKNIIDILGKTGGQ